MSQGFGEKDDEQMNREAGDAQADNQVLERGLVVVRENTIVKLAQSQPEEAGVVRDRGNDFVLGRGHAMDRVER